MVVDISKILLDFSYGSFDLYAASRSIASAETATEKRSYNLPYQAHLHGISQKPSYHSPSSPIMAKLRQSSVLRRFSRTGARNPPFRAHFQHYDTFFKSEDRMHSITSIILAFSFVICTIAVPRPPRTRTGSLIFPEADQECVKMSCPNPSHTGAAFCRNLNRGCYLCLPNPPSLLPFLTFACIGHWELERPLEVSGVSNVSANRSAIGNAFDIETAVH